MKVSCAVFLLLVVLAVSEARNARRFSEKVNFRTPFQKRMRIFNPKIVGGNPARIEDFPHHLGIIDLDWPGYICGASNISPRFALTAAHCLDYGLPPHMITLWGGSTSILTGGRTFFIDQYTLHPQYDDWLLDNDVAIMRMDPDSLLQGFPNVSPIQLPPVCDSLCCGVCVDGNPIAVAGWGVYNVETQQIPENLLQIQKPIFNRQLCHIAWRGWGGITSRMFCTVVENGVDSCHGDSGGAVIRDGIQVGIVSFGSPDCGDGSYPAVYVRLEDPMVRNWIRAETGV